VALIEGLKRTISEAGLERLVGERTRVAAPVRSMSRAASNGDPQSSP
jgi:hypothetical protein